MGSISTRKRKDGSNSYLARAQVMRDGTSYHETKTFDRRPAVAAWIKKREKELAKPGALEELNVSDPPLYKAIERYTEETVKDIGRTKAQVLRTIATYPIADLPCSTIKSKDIIEFLQSLPGQPQTVGNYASHLASIFAIARPMWDFRLDDWEMRDAITGARRMGIVSRSAQRNRRPTLDELDRLLAHFIDRRQRTPHAMPMHKVIVFALFSTRRQAEITRLTWADSQKEHKRVLVRDMKHPGAKRGNDTWLDLPDEAIRIIDSMPEHKAEIFPYSPDAITANFTRACRLLGIEDLHFYDLHHEGISRLFEIGWNIPHVAAVSAHRSWVSLKRYTHIRETGDKYANWHGMATLPAHPDSVPVNLWNEIEGVPVQARAQSVDPFALVRIVALARILMPASVVRLSAGRTGMSDELQALCFLAGTNSIFLGDQLLTTGNPAAWKDQDLLTRLGMHVTPAQARPPVAAE